MELLEKLESAGLDDNGNDVWQILGMTAKLALPEHHVRLELSLINVGQGLINAFSEGIKTSTD